MGERAVVIDGVELRPVSTEVAARLRELYDGWNRGGPEAMVREGWHPEIVWHDPPDFPDARSVRGAEEVERHLEARMEILGRAKIALERAWHAPGELVLVELSLDTGGRWSGVELEVPLFHLIRLTDGRAAEVREFMRLDQATSSLT